MPVKPQKQAIAHALGVSPQRVTAMIKQGMPSDTIPAAKTWYLENIKPRNPPDEAGSIDGDTLAAARLREARAKAQRIEMDNAERLGKLVDKAGVERAAYQFGRIIQKTMIDVLPGKVAMELAQKTDPWDIECYLREVIRAELSAVAGLSGEEVERMA